MKKLAVTIADICVVAAKGSAQGDTQWNKTWVIDNSALRDAFGVTKMIGLEQGIKRYIDELRQGVSGDYLIWWE